MEGMERDPLFVALTKPQMFAGVSYSYFVINVVAAMELFLIFRSPLVLLAALTVHFLGVALCLNEPRMVDLWLAKVRLCPRVGNFRIWECNSYRP